VQDIHLCDIDRLEGFKVFNSEEGLKVSKEGNNDEGLKTCGY
jgi:hypothetical protein